MCDFFVGPGARLRHLKSQRIGGLPEDLLDFVDFYEQRKTLLVSRIRQVLNR